MHCWQALARWATVSTQPDDTFLDRRIGCCRLSHTGWARAMNSPELLQQFEYWTQQGLIWIGFGTLVGLVAKAIMPGRDPGGPLATLMMGIVGAVIGGGALALAIPTHRVTPISPLGFVVSTVGALVILAFFRLFVGRWILPERPPVGTITALPAERTLYSRRRRAVRYEVDE